MTELFAQTYRSQQYRRDYTEEYLTIAAIVLGVALILILISSFLVVIARVLRKIDPEHRRMEPGEVWRNLIPVYNLVWVTVTVERVAESIQAEFTARGLHGPDEDYGRRTGIYVLLLLASGVFVYTIFLCFPAAIVQALRYRAQMKMYAERLKEGQYSPPPVDEGW